MGSADWMNKSMYYRIEVCFPIYVEQIKREIIRLINIQLADNVKAVNLNEHLQNIPIGGDENTRQVRSQKVIFDKLNSWQIFLNIPYHVIYAGLKILFAKSFENCVTHF